MPAGGGTRFPQLIAADARGHGAFQLLFEQSVRDPISAPDFFGRSHTVQPGKPVIFFALPLGDSSQRVVWQSVMPGTFDGVVGAHQGIGFHQAIEVLVSKLLYGARGWGRFATRGDKQCRSEQAHSKW